MLTPAELTSLAQDLLWALNILGIEWNKDTKNPQFTTSNGDSYDRPEKAATAQSQYFRSIEILNENHIPALTKDALAVIRVELHTTKPSNLRQKVDKIRRVLDAYERDIRESTTRDTQSHKSSD